jgi:hypothetical protein
LNPRRSLTNTALRGGHIRHTQAQKYCSPATANLSTARRDSGTNRYAAVIGHSLRNVLNRRRSAIVQAVGTRTSENDVNSPECGESHYLRAITKNPITNY